MQPSIQGLPVCLGDIVAVETRGILKGLTQSARVKGWSPDGEWLSLEWIGVVKIDQCQWAADLKATFLAQMSNPVEENCWKNDLATGLPKFSRVVA